MARRGRKRGGRQESRRGRGDGPRRGGARIGAAAPIVAWALAALALAAALRYGWELTCDDAFISYRYADNLARGHGLAWNPGEAVEGYSNFLWVLLLAAASRLGLAIPAAAQGLSVLAAIALVAGAAALVRGLLRQMGEDEGVAWLLAGLAVTLLALDADLLFWLTSGLETTAYSAAVVWAVALSAGGASSRRLAFWGTAGLSVLAALIRPDGHLVPIALGVVALWRARRGVEGWSFRRVALWAAAVALPLGAYHVFRYATFSDLLPNTFHARAGGPRPLVDGLVYLGRMAADRGLHAALAALALGWRRAPLGATLWTCGLLAGGIVAVGGDWMDHQRLLVPLAAPLAAAAAVAAWTLVRGRPRPALVAVAILLPCALLSAPGPAELGRLVTFRGAAPESAQEGTMVEAQRRAARWVVGEADEGDLVAANHVGAFGFEARDLPVLDMVGLTDRHVATEARGEGLHRRFDLDYVVSREPDWVILNSRRRPEHGEYPGDYWPGETLLARSRWFRSRCVQVHLEGWRWSRQPEGSWVLVYRCGPSRAVAMAPGLDPSRLKP